MYWLVRSLWIRNNDRLSNGLENKRAYRTAAWRGVRLLASRVFTSTPPSSKAFIVSTLFVLAAMCKRESSSLFLSCKLSPSTEYSITNVDFLSLFSIRSQGLPSQMFSPFLVGVELSITSPRSRLDPVTGTSSVLVRSLRKCILPQRDSLTMQNFHMLIYTQKICRSHLSINNGQDKNS